MKRTILAALLAFPALAFAGSGTKWQSDKELQIREMVPSHETTVRSDTEFQIRETAIESGFNCNTGGASSLLVGAALIGLVARRRK